MINDYMEVTVPEGASSLWGIIAMIVKTAEIFELVLFP